MKKKLTPAESAGSIGYNYKKARRNSGKHINRRFRIALGRVAVAVMTAAVLALTGVLPAGSGRGTGLIPATVEAAGPSTGTITFYKYTRYNKPEDFPKSWSENVIIFNRDGDNYYFMNSLNDCEDGHWLGTNVNVDPRIDPDAESFITRNKWSDYYIYNTDIGYMIYEYYNGEQLSVSCVTSGGHAPYLTAKSGGYTGFPFPAYINSQGWFGAQSITGNRNNTAVCYWKGHPGCGVWYGFGYDIRGDEMSWRVFEISRVTYNCINADYSIGREDVSHPQVYQANGANGGLFLREGVTLTVPKNSVLVVKNGFTTFLTISSLIPHPSSLKTNVSVSARISSNTSRVMFFAFARVEFWRMSIMCIERSFMVSRSDTCKSVRPPRKSVQMCQERESLPPWPVRACRRRACCLSRG